MDYYELLKKISNAKIEAKTIGFSEEGRSIYALFVGNTNRAVIVQGSIHGRENITADLVFMQVEYLSSFSLNDYGFVLIPMTNPDGVQITFEGEYANSKERRGLLSEELKKVDKSLFKSNANLVDLNVNFDAEWGRGEQNVKYPHFENYIGKFAHSERETKILVDITKRIKPIGTISYHTKGEEIYSTFSNFEVNEKSSKYGIAVSDETGYPLRYPKGSVGGYKDWCISKMHIPSLTIEVGSDSLEHPITKDSLPSILKNNISTPLIYIKEIIKDE